MSLLGFLEPKEDRTVNGMLYSNYALEDCSVHYLGFTQIMNPVTTFEVSSIYGV